MFETKEEITGAVDAIYAIAQTLERGQILTHEAIRSVLGTEPHVGSWDHIVNRVRKRIQDERGIATWPENTVGYKLLTTVEQLDVPVLRLKRAARQARRGRKSVEALPEKSLTMHQRRVRLFMVERAKVGESAIRREIRDMTTEVKPTATLPRKPVPVK